MSNRIYDVAVVEGDGIGPEVCQSTVEVLMTALEGTGSKLKLNYLNAGAQHYLKTGDAMPQETMDACANADVILHGAAGLPDVTAPDGTEPGLDFGLKLRFTLDLYANTRPIKLLPGITSVLRDKEPGQIDYVILRENTEGLYAARGGGNLLRRDVASDTLLMTRKGTERIIRQAFELSRARGKGAPYDGKKRVTCCDKANVLKSYAFFRNIFREIAEEYPDIEADYAYADAITVHMVHRPEFYDVIVTENMFGDIISDLGSATVGSMGMSPSAELGDTQGFFQASHGSAPDIAGKGIANPLGTILAGQMALEWLGRKHDDSDLSAAAERVERAVSDLVAEGKILTADLGGTASTRDVTAAVCSRLQN